jgi:protein ImuA
MPDAPSSVVSMSCAASRAAELARLKDRLRDLERGGRGEGPALSLGLPELDAALPEGGLALGAVHELIAADSADGSVFALAARWLGLAQRRQAGKWVLWCGRAERLYGPGLVQLGLDPARLVTVRSARAEDALWVMEEALRCRDLAGAVAEIEGLSLAQSRRLQLAAEAGGIGFLVRAPDRAGRGAPELGASAAVTRWRIGALPGAPAPAPGVLGPPRWKLELLRCRGGRPASFILEGEEDGATGGLALAAALRDGPHPSARARA